MSERIFYLAWLPVAGLSHDERMARVQTGDHHDYYSDLVEVAPRADAPDSLGTEG